MMIGELRWVAPEDAIEDEGLSMDQASTQQTPLSQREWDNRRENDCDLAISLLGQGECCDGCHREWMKEHYAMVLEGEKLLVCHILSDLIEADGGASDDDTDRRRDKIRAGQGVRRTQAESYRRLSHPPHCFEHPNLSPEVDMQLHRELFELGPLEGKDQNKRRKIEEKYISGRWKTRHLLSVTLCLAIRP